MQATRLLKQTKILPPILAGVTFFQSFPLFHN